MLSNFFWINVTSPIFLPINPLVILIGFIFSSNSSGNISLTFFKTSSSLFSQSISFLPCFLFLLGEFSLNHSLSYLYKKSYTPLFKLLISVVVESGFSFIKVSHFSLFKLISLISFLAFLIKLPSNSLLLNNSFMSIPKKSIISKWYSVWKKVLCFLVILVSQLLLSPTETSQPNNCKYLCP